MKKQVQEIATKIVGEQSPNDIARRGKIWTMVQVLATLVFAVIPLFLLFAGSKSSHLSQEAYYIFAGFVSVASGVAFAGVSVGLRFILHVSHAEKFAKAYEALRAIPQVPDEENYGLPASVPA